MLYKTHINFGVLFALLFCNLIIQDNIYLYILFVIISAIMSLIPDMDHKKSYIRNNALLLFITSLIVISYQDKVGLLITIAWLIITLFSKHRSFTHSILGCFIFCISFYNTEIFIPVILGYISHLFSDMITKSGVPLFYPIKKRIKLPIFSTGTKGEMILCWIMLGANIILVINIVISCLR